MIGAEHQAKLHGTLYSPLCHSRNGPAVSKAMKIKKATPDFERRT